MTGACFGGPLLICLLKLTLYKKSLAYSLQFGLKYHASSASNYRAYSLQFGLKYHVSSDSLWAQITEHTDRNYVTVALYYVGEELENL